MIRIYNVPSRTRFRLDPCRQIEHQLMENPYFKAVFFMCGVAQQLINLGVLEEEDSPATMSEECLPCWWRVFSSNYRPSEEEIGIFKLLAMQSADVSEETVDHLLFWYPRYIDPDFFGRKPPKPNEQN